MSIFKLTYRRDAVEEVTLFVEADDEKLLRQNLSQIEECLDDVNWSVCDGDDVVLDTLHEMSPEMVKAWRADKKIQAEHHFHYEDAAPAPEPVDPRQMALCLGESK
jgi:hypothetical protein